MFFIFIILSELFQPQFHEFCSVLLLIFVVFAKIRRFSNSEIFVRFVCQLSTGRIHLGINYSVLNEIKWDE